LAQGVRLRQHLPARIRGRGPSPCMGHRALVFASAASYGQNRARSRRLLGHRDGYARVSKDGQNVDAWARRPFPGGYVVRDMPPEHLSCSPFGLLSGH
jgi:hypothetical protein